MSTELYAKKIFHKITNYLIKFIHPKKIGKLSLDDIHTVVIEVAEQEIERPIKKQKSYYSAKKTIFHEDCIIGLSRKQNDL